MTVFPPVLGPVITNVEKSFPRTISFATDFEISIKGCLALIKLIDLSFEIKGSVAFILFAYLPLAKIKSIIEIKLILFSNSFVILKNKLDSF